MTSIGVRGVRLKMGLTQAQFADALGTTVTTVSRWETGGRKPSRYFERNLLKYVERQKRKLEKRK